MKAISTISTYWFRVCWRADQQPCGRVSIVTTMACREANSQTLCSFFWRTKCGCVFEDARIALWITHNTVCLSLSHAGSLLSPQPALIPRSVTRPTMDHTHTRPGATDRPMVRTCAHVLRPHTSMCCNAYILCTNGPTANEITKERTVDTSITDRPTNRIQTGPHTATIRAIKLMLAVDPAQMITPSSSVVEFCESATVSVSNTWTSRLACTIGYPTASATWSGVAQQIISRDVIRGVQNNDDDENNIVQ